MYVATFEACPPGQHDTKISPVARGAESFKLCQNAQIILLMAKKCCTTCLLHHYMVLHQKM